MENPVNRLIGRAVTQHAIDTVFLRTFFSKKGGKFGKGEKGKEGGGGEKKRKERKLFSTLPDTCTYQIDFYRFWNSVSKWFFTR